MSEPPSHRAYFNYEAKIEEGEYYGSSQCQSTGGFKAEVSWLRLTATFLSLSSTFTS